MKRTKNIRRSSFRKTWKHRHLTSIILAISIMFLLTSCEKNDKIVSLYQNSDNFTTDQNTNVTSDVTQKNELKTSESLVQEHSTQETCITKLNEKQCQQESIKTDSTQDKQAQSNNNLLIPLITGYMMGRLTDTDIHYYQHGPLFGSKTSANQNNQYDDTRKTDYDVNQTNNPKTTKKTIFSPEQKTVTTITRGGFGESIATQNSIQHNTTKTLTMGG